MKKINIALIAALGIALSACIPEPAKRAVARGDHDSIEGAIWTAYVYETPYNRGNVSYDMLVLTDVGDARRDNRSGEQIRQDFTLEMIELGGGLCAGLRRPFQGFESEAIDYPFVKFYIDCL